MQCDVRALKNRGLKRSQVKRPLHWILSVYLNTATVAVCLQLVVS